MNVPAINNENIAHDMRANILRRRYLWKDEQGNIVETEDQMFRRVAKHVAGAEAKIWCNRYPDQGL